MKWIGLSSSYERWIESLYLLGIRAVDHKKEECTKCGICCALRPCIPTPEELDKIAKFLKMKTNEMVSKYFVCDSFNSSDRFIFPSKETQLDIVGTYIDYTRTYDKGYCIFFDKDKKECKIYSVRPKHAKDTNCWGDVGKLTEEAVNSWKGVDVKQFGILD